MIYLFRTVGKKYKIGRSRDPKMRFGSFSSLPFRMEMIHTEHADNDERRERELHGQYSAHRIGSSEWFALPDAAVAEITGASPELWLEDDLPVSGLLKTPAAPWSRAARDKKLKAPATKRRAMAMGETPENTPSPPWEETTPRLAHFVVSFLDGECHLCGERLCRQVARDEGERIIVDWGCVGGHKGFGAVPGGTDFAAVLSTSPECYPPCGWIVEGERGDEPHGHIDPESVEGRQIIKEVRCLAAQCRASPFAYETTQETGATRCKSHLST